MFLFSSGYTPLISLPLLSQFPLNPIIKPMFWGGIALGIASTLKALFWNTGQGGKSVGRIITGFTAYVGIMIAFNLASANNTLTSVENSIEQGSDKIVSIAYVLCIIFMMFGSINFAWSLTAERNILTGLVCFIGGLVGFGVFNVIF
jgi:hypothetical protein